MVTDFCMQAQVWSEHLSKKITQIYSDLLRFGQMPCSSQRVDCKLQIANCKFMHQEMGVRSLEVWARGTIYFFDHEDMVAHGNGHSLLVDATFY